MMILYKILYLGVFYIMFKLNTIKNSKLRFSYVFQMIINYYVIQWAERRLFITLFLGESGGDS